ncbi:MAG: helix-turn-helix transcriptional regulator [Lachnospiraceae bacterium]|nr:helix-turn-helix transcriptional regulator [Lachnospiraceae bacterium]
MNIKDYLKANKTSISYISKKTDLPYTTVSELINGKVSIDKVYVGTAMKLAEACGLSFMCFYKMCKETTSLPEIPDGRIIIKNKRYYLEYDIDGKTGVDYLFKVNPGNTKCLEAAAISAINDIRGKIRSEK